MGRKGKVRCWAGRNAMPAEVPPAALWLREFWEELRSFNFEWIAAASNGIVAHDPELERVMAEVAARGLAHSAVYGLVDFEEIESELRDDQL